MNSKTCKLYIDNEPFQFEVKGDFFLGEDEILFQREGNVISKVLDHLDYLTWCRYEGGSFHSLWRRAYHILRLPWAAGLGRPGCALASTTLRKCGMVGVAISSDSTGSSATTAASASASVDAASSSVAVSLLPAASEAIVAAIFFRPLRLGELSRVGSCDCPSHLHVPRFVTVS